MKISMVTSGDEIWHVEYMQNGIISRTFCEKKIIMPYATNILFMSKESVCKKCARLCCDFARVIDTTVEV